MMEADDEKVKPWLGFHFGHEVHLGEAEKITVNVSANDVVEIDKLYGPLCATNVRVFLEHKDGKCDWVVQRQRIFAGSAECEWIEMARWDCQMDWPF